MPETASTEPYVSACPAGCGGDTLAWTGVTLPEGRLRCCRSCGQWVSACSEARYWQSMEEFDDARGTRPEPGAEARWFKQRRRRLNAITASLRRAPERIHLLDVGCSSGAFVHTAVRLGFDAEGVDPAPAAAQAARVAGLKVEKGLLHEVGYAEHSFDAVTLFEVIEHVRDPIALLRECHRILRPGGVLMVGTGNCDSWTAHALGARWEYLDISRHGGHISFFNPGSLRLAARRTGFTPLRLVTRSGRLVDASRGAGYLVGKLAGELLNLPARWLGKGHDMLAILECVQ